MVLLRSVQFAVYTPSAIGQLMFYTDRFARDSGGTSDSGEPILTSLAIGCSKGDV